MTLYVRQNAQLLDSPQEITLQRVCQVPIPVVMVNCAVRLTYRISGQAIKFYINIYVFNVGARNP